ncbi:MULTISPECIES: hypothetical protein [unclassified Pseudomonas]|uniref:hypothetical protein n=1 Tax=unclassified Pseudomonas TaxID=196821 RepID=UPI00244C0EEF|nr:MULTISPECIES: hypothetical protein [unclassified Pseudomonas]MDH0304147.1 hypothetical protein [Pseudomonas sp. GD04091]MDH1984019.1 hypothetical protein [Pseudomonas sp. GD03689]
MIIETKGWVAQNDKMPGDMGFRVYGTVTVPHPGFQVTLKPRAIQDKSFALALDLESQQLPGNYLQALDRKPVTFEMPGDHSNIPKVDIFYNDELIASITNIVETH